MSQARKSIIPKKLLSAAGSNFLDNFTKHRHGKEKLGIEQSLQAAFDDVAEKFIGIRPIEFHRRQSLMKQLHREFPDPPRKIRRETTPKTPGFDDELQRQKDVVDGKR